MRWALGVAILTAVGATACNYDPDRLTGDGGTGDGTDPLCGWGYQPANFDPCDRDPHDALTLSNGKFTFDPATGEVVENDTNPIATLSTTGTSPRVLAVGDFVIDNASLVILGPDALIIAVDGDATIDGSVIVSARGTDSGAGASNCAGAKGGDADGARAKSAGGGGAGGGFGSFGAAGGVGDTDIPTKTPGGVQSPVIGGTNLVPLRGGCPGGPGGEEHPTAVATPGAGGGAGGAIEISARGRITLAANSQIEANGGGGGGATNTSDGDCHAGAGGGGGGSGGAILLEAVDFNLNPTTKLCANGGAGASGSHANDDGTAGPDATCVATAALGPAGAGANNGDGGNGAARVNDATEGGPGAGADGGGGGGGGGVGRIRVHAIGADKPSNFLSSPPAVVD